jgi:cellulose synthase/poly-beta-1,6-N-acetylglucosamine synthase-like glycosyltransferase
MSQADAAPPPFTALVAAWNEALNLDQHILSFKALARPDCDLVISAGGSDGSYDIAQSFACRNIKVLQQTPGQGKQGALHMCLQHACHELLYFTDADCEFNSHVIDLLLDPLIAKSHTASTGGCHPNTSQLSDPFVQYQACEDFAFFKQRRMTRALLGRNFAITRACLDSVQGLDLPAPTGTDYHLDMLLRLAGASVAYVGDSQVATRYPQHSREYLKHARRWIKNPIVWEPRRRLLPFMISLLLAVLLLSGPALILTRRPTGVRLWFLLTGYVLCRRLRTIAHGKAADLPVSASLFMKFPLYVALEQIAVIAAALDLVTSSKRMKW